MRLGFTGGALTGRLLAIIVLTAVSGGSFALGYLVGTTATPREIPGAIEQPFEEPAATEEPAGVPDDIASYYEEPVEPIDLPEMVEKEPEVQKPAPAEAPKVKRRAIKKTHNEPYSVQAGVFEEQKYADSFAEELKGKGYDAFIEEGGGGVYKVKVGDFASREEAAALARRLKDAEGIGGFVTGPE